MDESRHPVSLSELACLHYSLVYRYAFRLCGSVEEAEDLTQQAFLTGAPAAASTQGTGFRKGLALRHPAKHVFDANRPAAIRKERPAATDSRAGG